MEKKIVKVIEGENAVRYCYDREKGELAKVVNINNGTYDMKSGELTLPSFDLSNGSNIKYEDVEGYISERAFKEGKKVALQILERDINEVAHSLYLEKTDDDGRRYHWLFRDGCPTKWYVDEHVVSHGSLHTEYDETKPKDEEIYDSPEEACLWNTYKVRDYNGEETERKGILGELILTDEQMDAFRELKDAFRKCERLDISFMLRKEDDPFLIAYNANNVRLYYGLEADEEKGEKNLNYDSLDRLPTIFPDIRLDNPDEYYITRV